jgi:hypothetical protein
MAEDEDVAERIDIERARLDQAIAEGSPAD